MKYTIFIDQFHSVEWGLNLQEAAIFSFLYSVPTWAEAKLIDGKLFYHASRNKAIQDYPIVSEKPDTVYRIYRCLQSAGVIEWMKDGSKDMILITEKGKQWNNSEKNPTLIQELGKKSEITRKKIRNNSENFPTYTNTINTVTNNNSNSGVENADVPEEEEMIDSKQTEKKERKSSAKKKETTAEETDLVSQVVQYLNEKIGASFKTTTKETVQFITARKKVDGWELEDFKLIIDFKIHDWGNDDRMRQYICPSTLFRSSNAEKYMQAAKAWKEGYKAGENGKVKPGSIPLFRQEDFANVDKSKFKF